VLAGHIYSPRKIKLIDVPDLPLDNKAAKNGDGQILFQPELACLCGSDLLFFEGDYPEYQSEVGQSLRSSVSSAK